MRLMRVMACLLLMGSVASGQDRGVSADVVQTEKPPETSAARAVRLTEMLEADPFRDGAESMREELLTWVVDTPDYMVRFCDILGPIPDDASVPNGNELMQQHMFGNVSYQIRNPGKTDELAVQVAAMQSLLKVYAFYVSKDPKGARIPYFDKLLALERKGELKEHLRPIVARKCKAPGKREEPQDQ